MHRPRPHEDVGDLLSLPSAPDDLRASSVSSQSTSSDLSSSSSSSSFYSPSSFVPANLTDKVSSLFSLTAPLSASSSSSLSSASSRFTGSPSPVSDEAELLDGELDEIQHAGEWSAAELVLAGKLPSAALTTQQAQQAAATILSSSAAASLASSSATSNSSAAAAGAANTVLQAHNNDTLSALSTLPSAAFLPPAAATGNSQPATASVLPASINFSQPSHSAAHATQSSHAPQSLDDVVSSASSCSSNSSSSSSRAIDHTRITPAELHGRYTLIRYLGSGSYGHVHVARDGAGKEVAIKKIVNIFDNLTNAKRLLREIKILRMLQHVNVISLREILPPVDPQRFDDLLIVFEFVETDLQKLIHSDQPFSNDHVQYFLYQLLCGVKYIHSGHIIHRDLKPANILVNSDCSLKICDVGLARSTYDGRAVAAAAAQPPLPAQPTLTPTSSAASSTKPQLNKRASLSSSATVGLQPATALTRELTKHVVTRWYRAPELILLNDKYTTAIDMWSVGCILAELLSMQTQTYKHRMPLFPGRSVSKAHTGAVSTHTARELCDYRSTAALLRPSSLFVSPSACVRLQCFPFSADNPLAYTDQLDQLNVIFDVLGTPTDSDISKIENDKAKNYLRSQQKRPPINFAQRYPGADQRALHLLAQLLTFDPDKRLTAEQALAHPYLSELRVECEERVYEGSAVDFGFEDVKGVTKDDMRELIVSEILLDNPLMSRASFDKRSAASRTTSHASSSSSKSSSSSVTGGSKRQGSAGGAAGKRGRDESANVEGNEIAQGKASRRRKS